MSNTIEHTKGKIISNNIPLMFYIKSCLTFRYLSNISIIVCVLAYYMNAIEVFFIFAPLVIVNLFIILTVIIFNFNELMLGLLEKHFPDKENRDKIIPKYVLFNFFWHIAPVIWLIYILKTDDIVKIFHPNYRDIFIKSIIIPIIYYYYEGNLKIYGDINYISYFLLYIVLLIVICYNLYST